MNFNEIQAYISDIAGSMVVLGGLYGILFIDPKNWPFVALVGIGITAITGKKVFSSMFMNGVGGGTEVELKK